MNTELTDKLLARLAVLIANANDQEQQDDEAAGYWRGVVFGLETAIVEVRLAVEPPAAPSEFSEESIQNMEDSLDEGEYP